MTRSSAKQPKPATNLVAEEWLLRTLERVKSGELSPLQATEELSILPYKELAYAKPDHHRSRPTKLR